MKSTEKFLTLLPILLAVIYPVYGQVEEVIELTNVGFQKSEYRLEVLIELKDKIMYESFTLYNPNRLVIDLLGVKKIQAPSYQEIMDFGVKGVRTGLYKPNVARVVFDLMDKIPLFKIEELDMGLKVVFWEEMTGEIRPEEVKKVEEKPVIKPEEKPVSITPKLLPRPKEKMEVKTASIGFLSGYYFFQEQAFKDVYGSGGFFFGGEYSFLLPLKKEKFLDIWTGFKRIQKTGLTTYTEEEVKLKISSFSFAFRYVKNLERFTPFFGIGIDYYIYKERYPETIAVSSVGGSDLGFHIQGGSYYNFSPYLSAKIYFKYNIAKTLEEDVEVNLGGLEWGMAFLFKFDL